MLFDLQEKKDMFYEPRIPWQEKPRSSPVVSSKSPAVASFRVRVSVTQTVFYQYEPEERGGGKHLSRRENVWER